ncbi:MAG: hypothetical protein IJU41_03570 [Clostridia bacterium]|nr:hypothetical protein [Clostridia bacterium]
MKKKTKTKKRLPARSDQWITDDGLLRITAWARNGLTNAQIAHNMGIALTTLSVWRTRFPMIEDALQRGKEVVDIEVENALHQRAVGYTVQIRKAFKVRRAEFDPETGKKISEKESIEYGVEDVHVPADTTAQIFWLCNRCPDKWRRADKDTTGAETEIRIVDDI